MIYFFYVSPLALMRHQQALGFKRFEPCECGCTFERGWSFSMPFLGLGWSVAPPYYTVEKDDDGKDFSILGGHMHLHRARYCAQLLADELNKRVTVLDTATNQPVAWCDPNKEVDDAKR